MGTRAITDSETEQAMVAANRGLIIRFEKKSQTTLVPVWGESEPRPQIRTATIH